MIDFHTHSLLSDGVLLPSELARRARVKGYSAMAITDHADESNMDLVVEQLVKVARQLNTDNSFRVVPGVELTHIPVDQIPGMVTRARALAAAVVIGHGETLVEPVQPGTNRAFIDARVDILAHPGLVTDEDSKLAAGNNVIFEITSRKGHSLSNGHVAACALRHGVKMVINTDSHEPGDLITDEFARCVALGAGLSDAGFREIEDNARELLEKVSL